MSPPRPDCDPSLPASAVDLLAALQSGDQRALARAISLVEDRATGAPELLAACRSAAAALARPALRIGITGPPGAGKSTLADQLVRAFRAQGSTVAVLAVDPSSPFTGGALLGDRIRIASFSGDSGVYLRSMASRGAAGGLAAATADACTILEAAHRDVILIETVGAGQTEVEIAGLAHITLVILVPGMGDDVQSLKAGILEIADIFVLNKADHEGADRTEADVLAMQSLGSQPQVPLARTVATTGQGIDSLVEAIACLAAAQAPIMRNQLAHLSQPQLGLTQLDHIGIAVRSIAAAGSLYALLGLTITHEEIIEHEQVKTAMLPLGNTRIELLEPTAEDSTIARFLAKRGEGLHHIALRIEAHEAAPKAASEPGKEAERKVGIDALFDHLRGHNVHLASDRIRTGAGGHRYFFIHPESTGGVLIEIVSNPPLPRAPSSPAEQVSE